jgi:hypothetical protein
MQVQSFSAKKLTALICNSSELWTRKIKVKLFRGSFRRDEDKDADRREDEVKDKPEDKNTRTKLLLESDGRWCGK